MRGQRIFGILVAATAASGCGGGEGSSAPPAVVELSGVQTGGWIESVAFSADGKTLWAASETQVNGATGETIAFDVTTKQSIFTVDGPAWAVAPDPTDANLVIGGTTVSVVGATDGHLVRTLTGASGAAAWSHDGKWIAAVSSTAGMVNVYSAADGTLISSVAHPTVTNERIWRVTFSPDDSLLLTASGQTGFGSPHGTTLLWHTTDWSSASGVTCTTFDAAFSPDGTHLALACWEYAEYFDLTTATVVQQIILTNQESAMGVAFSPDGTQFAVGGLSGGAHVYSASTLMEEKVLTDGTTPPTTKAVAWSADGTQLAGGGWTDPLVRLWSAP